MHELWYFFTANFRRKAKLISGPSNMTVFEGESLTLKCTAVHFKNLVWVFNGRPVKHGVSLEELHIEKVNKSHEGQYTCYIWGSKRNTQTIEARAYVSVKGSCFFFLSNFFDHLHFGFFVV